MIVSWFSCGANSAVASWMALNDWTRGDELRLVRCVVENEHPDNDRFHADCEKWYGVPIYRVRSRRYKDCWEVWEDRRYISGVRGAPCTVEMKKEPRWDLEKEWEPHSQIFGFSSDEAARAARFREQNPEVRLLTPLIDAQITKPMCGQLVEGMGIALPVMYGMGFANNNCIACAKATSISYWARTRHFFPEQFYRMAELSRRIGCRLTRLKGVRIFLDEIPADYDWRTKKDRSQIDCGLWCGAS